MDLPQKNNLLRLWLVFTAVDFARNAVLRLSFMTMPENMAGWENKIYLVYCLATVAGLLIIPILHKYFRDQDSRTIKIVFCCLLVAAIASVIVAHFLTLLPRVVLIGLAVFTISAALSFCIKQAVTLLPMAKAGRFVGFSLGTNGIITFLVFFSPFWSLPFEVPLALICVLLAASALLKPQASRSKSEVSPQPPQKIIALSFGVMILFCMVADIADNLYFFDNSFELFPFQQHLVILLGIATFYVAGIIFDLTRKMWPVIVSFLLIALGQSMAFFSSNSLLVLPYAVFTASGSYTLQVFTIALPIYYAAYCKTSKLTPQLGFVSFYSCAFIVSLYFELAPPENYNIALGLILVLALIAISLTFLLSSAYSNYRFEMKVVQVPEISDYRKYGFSPREIEVMELLIRGLSSAEIAKLLYISEKTVRNHVSNMLAKSGCQSRSDLIVMMNKK